MKKFLLFSLLFCLGSTASAVQLEGVRLDDNVHLGNRNLVLNGAGVRNRYFLNLYVAALYLSAKSTSASAVLADNKEKRIALYMLREINAEDLLYGLTHGMERNTSDEEMQAIAEPVHEFSTIFHQMGNVEAGDVILLDYQPGAGMQISVNGSARGTSPGSRLFAALLKVWLGENPAQDALKLKLLGAQ